jgi:Phosphotransferase enzyme family
VSASLPPVDHRPLFQTITSPRVRDLIDDQIPNLLGAEACLLHPRKGYEGGAGGGDFDFAVDRIDLEWPLRATGVRVCQCIRHSPGGWYWVIERSEDVFAVDALDDPQGIGQLNFPTRLAFTNDDSQTLAIRASFVTMKRLAKRMRDEREWDPIIGMARTDPDTYIACLEACLGSKLGQQIGRSVLAGRTPEDDAWKWTLLSLRVRRIRTPRRAATLLIRSLDRLVGRLRQPTGLIVVVVGPDGAGKSALASTLIDRCGAFFWATRRIHWRPGLLPRLGPLVGRRTTDPETPHLSNPNGRMISVAVLLYYWLDFFLGTWLKQKPLRVRSGLIVVERGWWDILVDPRRYRLQLPKGLTAMLGRLLPSPDLTLVLDAPASVLLQRKQELAEAELDRQVHAWRELAQRHPVSYSVVDASQPESDVQAAATEEVVSRLERRTAARTGPGWLALPRGGSVRWMIPRGSRSAALEGLRVYQPMTLKGRLAWEVARGVAGLGALRLLARGEAPDRAIRQVLAPHIPRGGTVAVAKSNHAARFVALIIDGTGAASAIAKVALDQSGREALEKEASILRKLGPLLPAPLRAPQIVEQGDGFVLLEAVRWRPRLRPWELPADVAHALGGFYAAGQVTNERGLAHGDFAPWNLLWTTDGWVVVDWESGDTEAPPFYDLFHFLVQSCVRLGRPSQEAVVQGVVAGEGSVARLIGAYADGARILSQDASWHFLTYLRASRATLNPATPDYHAGMRARDQLEWNLGVGPRLQPREG